MANKPESGRLIIEFICTHYSQKQCEHFKQDKNVPSTTCKFGLFDRPCTNKVNISHNLIYWCEYKETILYHLSEHCKFKS